MTSPTKPYAAAVIVENIPTELRKLDRWVAWRYEYLDGKWEKVPWNPRSGRKASVTKPSDCSSCEKAVAFYHNVKADGIGFILFREDGYVVLDLDECRDFRSGYILPWAAAIVHEVQSYTEASPSETGLRIVVRGKLPGDRGRNKGGKEIYSHSKFCTFTGMHVSGTSTIVEDRQEEVARLYERVFGTVKEQARPPAVAPETGLTDDEIISRATKANGEKFTKLMLGDTSDYDSPSEADLALLAIFAYWTVRDRVRMEELFERSALADRKKWERADYRERTIDRAMRPTLTRRTKDNQDIQDIQGKTGIDTPHSRDVCARTVSADLGIDQTKYQQESSMGVTEAIELAGTQTKLPCGVASFNLARRLRNLSDERPEQFEYAVRAFCEHTGHDFEEFWYAFLASWSKVKVKEGDDVLTWAFEMAKVHPQPPSHCPAGNKGKYALVASIAFHLAQRTDPNPFLLPCKRLAFLLGTSAMTVSNIISLLKQNKVVVCVDENYEFTKKKAKEYRLARP
jgi:hypothetical protein